MRKLTIGMMAGLAVGVLGSGVAVADRLDDWDQNRDLFIDEREWDEGFTDEGVFDEWDRDGDGVLSREEFNSQVFRGYDRNKDRRLQGRELKAFVDDRENEGVFDD